MTLATVAPSGRIVRVAGVPTVPATVVWGIMGAGASHTARAAQMRTAVASGRLLVVRAPSGPASGLAVGPGEGGGSGARGAHGGQVTGFVSRRDLVAWADAVAAAGSCAAAPTSAPAKGATAPDAGKGETAAAVDAAGWLAWALRQRPPEGAGGAVTGHEEVVDPGALDDSVRAWLAERRVRAATDTAAPRPARPRASGASSAAGAGDSAVVTAVVAELLRMGVLIDCSPGRGAGQGATARGSASAATPTAAGYWWGSPRSTTFWSFLAAGRAEVVRRLRQCRYSEAAAATVLTWKLRGSPLPPQYTVWDALGSGSVAAIEAAAGRYLRVIAPTASGGAGT
jgi:hypothetical protein